MCMDIKDFYLATTMERAEYMWVPVRMLPDKVMEKYQLQNLVFYGHILTKITRKMYGLPQAVRIAYEKIVKNLAPFGYHPVKRTPGLWKHKTRPIIFCLVVDDFGVKYVGRKHAEHLTNAIKTNCNTT